MLRFSLSLLFFLFYQLTFSQNISGDIVFWSAQKWECEFLKIDLYNSDSLLVHSGKLDKIYKGFEIPECGSAQAYSLQNLDTGAYFFVADCSVEQCELCGGEGSYWQPIVHNETAKTRGTRNKGNIEGTWRTCYVCGGNGQASTILWVDTLKVHPDKCRSVLLK